MDSTPASLLQPLREPDAQHQWERFVDLYTPLLYFWACRAGLNGADASDLVQDVFVILLRRLPTFVYDPRHSFRAWLRTVTLNRSRRRCAGARPSLPWPASRSRNRRLPPRRRRCGAGCSRLSGRSRRRDHESEFQGAATWQACWALIVDGKSGAAVAAELGMNLDAVYAAKSRVLRRLRQELEGLLD